MMGTGEWMYGLLGQCDGNGGMDVWNSRSV